MPVVGVRLLDGVSVVQDDRTVEIRELGGMRGARALALVAERAGSSVTREELADVVWDGRPPASWASNLRLVVSALRRVVGVDALTVGPDGYRLVLPRSQVDLLELERATFEAERLPACEGWRPAVDALPPVDWVPLRGIDGSYADAVRRRVAELRRRLTLAIATGALELGLVREAEHHARDLIVADPLREDGHRLLMSALAASGNVGAALSAYETCRAVLADELGADPSPLTEGLFLSLLRDNGGRSAPATGATPARHRRVVTFAIEAAATAVRAGLFEDAELQARRGLAALQSTGAPDPALQRRLEVLRAAAARHLGDVAASHRLSDLAQDALASGDQRAVMDVALAGTSRGTVGDGAFADHGLMETYRVALERLGPAQEAARACLLGHVATSLAWREDGATGRTLAAEAVGLARDSGSPESLFTTLLSQRQAIAGQLDVDLQDRLEQEMETLAEELDDPVGRTRVAVHRFITAVERGDGDRLEDLLAVAAGHGEQTDSMLLAHQLDYTRAGLRLLRGDLAAAAQQIEGAAHAGRRAGVDRGLRRGRAARVVAGPRPRRVRLRRPRRGQGRAGVLPGGVRRAGRQHDRAGRGGGDDRAGDRPARGHVVRRAGLSLARAARGARWIRRALPGSGRPRAGAAGRDARRARSGGRALPGGRGLLSSPRGSGARGALPRARGRGHPADLSPSPPVRATGSRPGQRPPWLGPQPPARLGSWARTEA